jgi:LysR family transcriptional regulator, hca operon transcriptional activator
MMSLFPVKGFLGTGAPFAADFNLVMQLILGAALIAGVLFALRAVIDDYLKRSGINITPAHEVDHLSMGMSLIVSTRGVGLLPAYAQNFLPASVTSAL